MKELYTSPVAEIIMFDTKDVITTSGGNGYDDGFADKDNGQVANEENGWSGLY